MSISLKQEGHCIQRAWGYLRRSTDRQKQSVEDQRREIEKYAKKNGYKLANTLMLPAKIFSAGCFLDDAISGAGTDAREAFKKMIELACSKEHPVDVILVWNIARLGRYDPDEGGHYRYWV